MEVVDNIRIRLLAVNENKEMLHRNHLSWRLQKSLVGGYFQRVGHLGGGENIFIIGCQEQTH